MTSAHILKLAKVRRCSTFGGTLEHCQVFASDSRVRHMQMGAYNTIPFFRVDKVRTELHRNWNRRTANRTAPPMRLGSWRLPGLQGFVAQCTDVLGNRLVPLNARQRVRLLHTCAASVIS